MRKFYMKKMIFQAVKWEKKQENKKIFEKMQKIS